MYFYLIIIFMTFSLNKSKAIENEGKTEITLNVLQNYLQLVYF
jgi:hypothetical protein